MKLIKAKGVEVAAFEPLLREDEFYNSMMWLIGSVTEDYVGVFMGDTMTRLRSMGIQGQFVSKVTKSTEAKKFVAKYQELLR